MGSSAPVCEKGEGGRPWVFVKGLPPVYFLLFCTTSVEGSSCFLLGPTGLDHERLPIMGK